MLAAAAALPPGLFRGGVPARASAQYLGYVPYSDETIPCAGDCNGDRAVRIDEILTMVNIALGTLDLEACLAADRNQNGEVTIDEILAAIGRALSSCDEE